MLRHNQDENNQGGSGAGRQVSEVVAYRSISDMPSVRDLAIQVCLCACCVCFLADHACSQRQHRIAGTASFMFDKCWRCKASVYC